MLFIFELTLDILEIKQNVRNCGENLSTNEYEEFEDTKGVIRIRKS